MKKELYKPMPAEIGKLQPQAIEIENAVIGSIIYDQDAFHLVSAMLKPEHFYKEQNGIIYQACMDLSAKSEKIDMASVSNQLKTMGKLEVAGGNYYLADMATNYGYQSYGIEKKMLIVVEKFLLREMIRMGTEIIREAYEDSTDCFELIDKMGTQLSTILNVVEAKKAKTLEELGAKVLDDCFEALQSDKPIGVPVSIQSLQKQIKGWKKGNLIVLAGRPGMGKTAVALDYGYYPASLGIPTAFFSMEMTGTELAGRLLSKVSYINSQKINNHDVTTDELTALRKDLTSFKNTPMFIDDTPALTMSRLRSKAIQLKNNHKIELIIVDYLQLMSGGSSKGNREQEISTISRGLKSLAKELELPIIALSQLSREVEKRPGCKPILSDLRESGAIEQDADMVIFLLRPEYYGQEVYMHGNEEMTTEQLLLFIIAKFRGGMAGDVKARWIASTTSITDWDRVDNAQTGTTEVKELPDATFSSIQPNNSFLNNTDEAF